jgi:hypothetical protein
LGFPIANRLIKAEVVNMANQQYLDLLNQGVNTWNTWRKNHPDVYPDLSGADLCGANLINTDLTGTNFSGADLVEVNLSHANLNNANLYEAHFSQTIFANVNLRCIHGLEKAIHDAPSLVDINTVILPQDENIRQHFLRGAGFSDTAIEYLPAILSSTSIQFHSLFISYSSHDATFAHRLHADLQKEGVRCWFAPQDMKIGDKVRSRIGEAIHLQDRLLLILSEHSVSSDWVEHEVEIALARERRDKRTLLSPIRLDNAILERPYTGWAALVQNERHIGDFTNWNDYDCYQIAFNKLIHDLKRRDE